jgi:hypothetical protein
MLWIKTIYEIIGLYLHLQVKIYNRMIEELKITNKREILKWKLMKITSVIIVKNINNNYFNRVFNKKFYPNKYFRNNSTKNINEKTPGNKSNNTNNNQY